MKTKHIAANNTQKNNMDYEKIATAAGYSIWKVAGGKFVWYHLDDSSSTVSFDTQKEAWKDCCWVNVLSKDCCEQKV